MKNWQALLGTSLIVLSTQANAFTYACQWVERMANKKEYKVQPHRVAVMKAPDELDSAWQLTMLERHGSWFIYQTPTAWYGVNECAPIHKESQTFMPVLLNRQTGRNAVITGNFLLKVHRAPQLQQVIDRYGFKVITFLPRPDSVMVDLRSVDSYDALIETMDIDKDVQLLAPILAEPRVRR